MNRLPILALSLTALFLSSAHADRGQLRRSYEAQRTQLNRDYHAQRRALSDAYRCSRDQLLEERRFIAHIDCHETRSRRLRANSRELSALARQHGRRNRELTFAYQDSLQVLRDDYELARSRMRHAHRAGHVVVQNEYAHPANCTCNVCAPPPQPVPRHEPRYRDHYQDRRSSHRRPDGLDIAAAILSLLN